MSSVALAWVRNVARPQDHADFRLLTLLADAAAPDGTGAFPSRATLAEGMMRSVRMVQRGLEALLAKGFIRRGDQSKVAHLARDKRPVVYDLVMDRAPAAPIARATPKAARKAPEHWRADTERQDMPCPPGQGDGVTDRVPPEAERGDMPCLVDEQAVSESGVTCRVTQTKNITTKEQNPPTPHTVETAPATIDALDIPTTVDSVVEPTDRIAAAKHIVEQYRTSPMCPTGKLATAVRAGITNATLELLKDGFTIRQTVDGIAAWSKAGMVSPTQIANFVNRAANTPADNFAHLPPASAKAAGWIQAGERLAAHNRPVSAAQAQLDADQRDFAAAARKELV